MIRKRTDRGVAGLSFLLETVAVSTDVDDGGAVKEPIEGRRGHDRVAGEDVAPIGEGFVACDDDGLLLLITTGDDLKEQAGLRGVESEVAGLVEHQQCRPNKILDLTREPVLAHGLGQAAMSMAVPTIVKK